MLGPTLDIHSYIILVFIGSDEVSYMCVQFNTSIMTHYNMIVNEELLSQNQVFTCMT